MKRLWLLAVFFFLVGCSSNEELPVYRIARDPYWFPLELMGKQPAVLGFSDSLVRAIGEEEDFSAQFISTGPDFFEWGLAEGKWDAILTYINPTLNYESRYSFSEPYLMTGPVLIVPSNAPVKSLKDLNGKVIAFDKGTDAITIIAASGENFVFVTYDSYAKALSDLLEGRYDAVIMPSIVAGSFLFDLYSNTLRIVGEPLTKEGLRLMTLKDNQDLVDQFNSGLRKLKSNGDYHSLLARWRIKA